MEKETLLTLGKPHKTCTNCNSPIIELERHPSTASNHGERLERQDYCPDCWSCMKEEAFESFWVTRRVERNKAVPKMNRRERSKALRLLFESVWDRRESEENVGGYLFLLAHLLMKWGGLKFHEEHKTEDGRVLLIFADPDSGDLLEVESVDLADEQIVAMKSKVEEFLIEFASDKEVEI